MSKQMEGDDQRRRIDPNGPPTALGVEPKPLADGISEAARPHFRRNFVFFSLDGGLFLGGLAFVSTEAILPSMVRSMGGSDFVISFLPMLMIMGFALPPLFTAHRVERMPRMMPYCAITGVFQRLPYLMAGLLLLFGGKDWPLLSLCMVVAAPFISGLFGGISATAWFTLISRTIPKSRRGSANAARNIIGTAIGVLAGLAVKQVLESYPGTEGYAYLHLCAFVLLALSLLLFVQIREVDNEPPGRGNHRSLSENLRSLPDLLRSDRRFRSFLVARTISLWMFLAIPFLSLEACERLGLGEPFAGKLIMAQMFGGIFGNLLGGYLGDKHGGKIMLSLARIAFLAIGVLYLFPASEESYLAAFFLLGACLFLHAVGGQIIAIEISPPERLPTYTAVMSLTSFIGMALVGLSNGLIQYLADAAFHWQLGGAALAVLISFWFLAQVREPRKDS